MFYQYRCAHTSRRSESSDKNLRQPIRIIYKVPHKIVRRAKGVRKNPLGDCLTNGPLSSELQTFLPDDFGRFLLFRLLND